MDYNLNDIEVTGVDVLKELRAQGYQQPIFLISGNKAVERFPELKAYNAQFIHKDDLCTETVTAILEPLKKAS